MGRHKKVGVVELTEDQTIPSVGEIKKLSGRYVQPFCGTSYNDSIRLAYEWSERKSNSDILFELINYYPQIMGHKSILVSYNIVDRKNKTIIESILVD